MSRVRKTVTMTKGMGSSRGKELLEGHEKDAYRCK
jgi:hypothetical protein